MTLYTNLKVRNVYLSDSDDDDDDDDDDDNSGGGGSGSGDGGNGGGGGGGADEPDGGGQSAAQAQADEAEAYKAAARSAMVDARASGLAARKVSAGPGPATVSAKLSKKKDPLRMAAKSKAVADLESSTVTSGFLWKVGGSGLKLKHWKRRFFVLTVSLI